MLLVHTVLNEGVREGHSKVTMNKSWKPSSDGEPDYKLNWVAQRQWAPEKEEQKEDARQFCDLLYFHLAKPASNSRRWMLSIINTSVFSVAHGEKPQLSWYPGALSIAWEMRRGRVWGVLGAIFWKDSHQNGLASEFRLPSLRLIVSIKNSHPAALFQPLLPSYFRTR